MGLTHRITNPPLSLVRDALRNISNSWRYFAFRNYMSIIEQRLSFADFTPAGNRVLFDLDDFLRGNPYERAQVYEILNRIGAMSIDEIREEEDMLL